MATFYQVGGSVRDSLMGLSSKDIDYAVVAPSFDAMREAIVERGGTIYLETPEYLTIRAKVPELGACDFVLCRKDGEYVDGRHPETVTPGTILDDLARRDFTINAIAKTEKGGIIDPYDGVHDLRMKWLRCVGKASDRFSEDGLRMLRALRFAITKDLMIQDDIYECLVDQQFFEPRLRGVSLERVREELHKCFAHDTGYTLYLFATTYTQLREWLFGTDKLWLEPTLKAR